MKQSHLARLALAGLLAFSLFTVTTPAQTRIKTGVFTAKSTTVIAGSTFNVPDQAGAQLRIPAGITVVESTLNVSLADKLSTGLHITFGVYVSDDSGQTWQFRNGFEWDSYGPDGLTVHDPDGTVRVNPDPRLQTNVSADVGNLIRAQAVVSRTVSAGLTVQVF